MRLRQHSFRIALTAALLVTACADKGDENTTETATTTGQTDTNDTNGPNPSGATEPDPTSGTTEDEPTSGATEPDPTAGDPGVYEQCKANSADADMLADAQCKCLVESGMFPDQAACLAEYGTTPEISECTCKVYGDNPESKATLDCIAMPQKTFVECFSKAGCDDSEAQQACFDAYFGVVLECPEPPPAVQSGISIGCYGETPFMCGSGEQILEDYKCDFEPDCMDGSDEVDCPGFMCKDGTKIPLDYECDGSPDCPDMSDEEGCPVFMCMDGTMIPEKQKCNGFPECMDESDEMGCPVFMCMSGEEIPEAWKCDGLPDCMDESDEMGCP